MNLKLFYSFHLFLKIKYFLNNKFTSIQSHLLLNHLQFMKLTVLTIEVITLYKNPKDFKNNLTNVIIKQKLFSLGNIISNNIIKLIS